MSALKTSGDILAFLSGGDFSRRQMNPGGFLGGSLDFPDKMAGGPVVAFSSPWNRYISWTVDTIAPPTFRAQRESCKVMKQMGATGRSAFSTGERGGMNSVKFLLRLTLRAGAVAVMVVKLCWSAMVASA